jgi:4-amino-4-deoxy-L-arabinose transferase-like glycosyltransferase
MLFTVAILWQTLRMLEAARAQSMTDWLLLGALLGLAGLSKYTAIFIALPVIICLLAAHGARVLRQSAPWVALLLALLLVVPVFIWNAQHDWISFAYQLHHGKGSAWQASPMGLFLLAQLLMYALPVWGALGLWRMRLSLGQSAALPKPFLGLLSFFALPFGVLMLLAGGGSSLPHWTAPAWVALLPFAGVGLAAQWAQGRRFLAGLLGVAQGVICALLFILLYSAGPSQLVSSEQPETINPLSDFYGWDRVGQRAQQLAKEKNIQHLAVQNWTLASRLAWYARPLPVHVLDPAFDQFSLWTGELPLGADAILLEWSQMAYKLPVGDGMFQTCEPAANLPVSRAERVVSRFNLYLCRGWGGKPHPRRWDEP